MLIKKNSLYFSILALFFLSSCTVQKNLFADTVRARVVFEIIDPGIKYVFNHRLDITRDFVPVYEFQKFDTGNSAFYKEVDTDMFFGFVLTETGNELWRTAGARLEELIDFETVAPFLEIEQ